MILLIIFTSSLADTGDSSSNCITDSKFTGYEMIDGNCKGDPTKHLCTEWPNDICPSWNEMIVDYYQSSKIYFFYECEPGYDASFKINYYVFSEESRNYTFNEYGEMIGRSLSIGMGQPFCCDETETYQYAIGDLNCIEIPTDPPPDPTPDSPAAPVTEDSTSKPAPACGCTSTGLSSALALLPLLLLTRRRQGQP